MGYHDRQIFTYGQQGQDRRDAIALLARLALGTPAEQDAARAEARSWLAWRGCYSASQGHISEAQG